MIYQQLKKADELTDIPIRKKDISTTKRTDELTDMPITKKDISTTKKN